MQNNFANDVPKVKVVIVGNSGVGKSSFVYLASHGRPLSNSSWTIGCSVEVRLHEYREGTPSQKSFFVEMWDVGGNNSHKNARHIFFTPVHGIILVHDLTNRKSQQTLNSWLSEVLLREAGGSKSRLPLVEGFDTEQFGGLSQIPIFVVGTRFDQVTECKYSGRLTMSTIADHCGAEEIFINCLDQRSLAPGSSNAVKLSRFFDRVIERQMSLGKNDPSSVGHQEKDFAILRRNKSNSIINIPNF